jgi:hypothetical protein
MNFNDTKIINILQKDKSLFIFFGHSSAFYSQLRGIVSYLARLTAVRVLKLMTFVVRVVLEPTMKTRLGYHNRFGLKD